MSKKWEELFLAFKGSCIIIDINLINGTLKYHKNPWTLAFHSEVILEERKKKALHQTFAWREKNKEARKRELSVASNFQQEWFVAAKLGIVEFLCSHGSVSWLSKNPFFQMAYL